MHAALNSPLNAALDPATLDRPDEDSGLDEAAARATQPGAGRTGWRLRVLTLNLHKGFTVFNRRFVLHEMREAVRATGADIVFLQEVLGAAHGKGLIEADTAMSRPQYEFLADTIWPQHAYGRNAVSPVGHHGNALLSRFPIVRHRNVDVTVGRVEKRGLLHCEIELPDMDQHLHAVCVHLGLREGQRQQQIDKLFYLMHHEVPADAPLVVAGDFNDWRLRGHARLQERLQEVHAHVHGHAPRTFPSRRPLLRLDRIYVKNTSQHRPLPLPRRPWSRLSDHAPLAAEVVL